VRSSTQRPLINAQRGAPQLGRETAGTQTTSIVKRRRGRFACWQTSFAAPTAGALRASPVQRLSSAMIGALLFINAKGEIILDRKYRDDYNKASVETFRNQASSARH
jgi:hypothetical protein